MLTIRTLLLSLLYIVTILVICVTAQEFSCRKFITAFLKRFPGIQMRVTTDFYLSTSKQKNGYMLKSAQDLKYYASFRDNNNTFVLIHGYHRSYDEPWIRLVEAELLKSVRSIFLTVK